MDASPTSMDAVEERLSLDWIPVSNLFSLKNLLAYQLENFGHRTKAIVITGACCLFLFVVVVVVVVVVVFLFFFLFSFFFFFFFSYFLSFSFC